MYTKSLLIAFSLSLLLLFSCSETQKSATGPDDNSPVAISVTPSSGAPGSPIKISGYQIDPLDTTLEIFVGDQLTVFLSDSSGVKALIPLFVDATSGWSQPPSSLQDVTIKKTGKIVALAKAALLIDSLPHADGATETIQTDLQVISNSLRTIWGALPEVPGDPRLSGYHSAVSMMLDSILVGADSSIAALIEGNSSWNNNQPLDLALIDAVLASSGTLEFYNEAATSLGGLTSSLKAAQAEGLLCKDGGPDMDLACQMQVYVILDAYATYFVKPTTTTYANTVGLVSGVLAVSGVGLAGEAIIGALLTVFDFVYGTLAPSLFPAEITQFSLDVQTDSIAVDEQTSTTIQISAVNHPATIRASDILDQLLNALGLAKASQVAANFREVLVNAMKWALDLYRKAIVQFNIESGGDVFIDPEAELPSLTWGPITITHSDLVELYSFTEDIITPDTASFEWKGVSRGDGRIQARARAAGERSKVLYDNALCWGCVYTGGAFGENAPGTETKTVVVGKPANLIVEINGLPNGTDGSVIVSGPEYSSGKLTATETLTDLEPGDYTITAIEVKDGNGDTQIPSPIDTTVTLDDGDHKTVTITYEPEYGNMLLTVSGLPEGVDADISMSGPKGASYQIYSDSLIDSLTPGEYIVTAKEVLDLDGTTTLTPDPKIQNVTVTGGQTATANVTYEAGSKLRVFVGAYDHQLEYFAESTLPVASVHCGSSSDGFSDESDYLFLPDLSYDPDCKMEGGVEMTPGESYSFSASCGSGTASGNSMLSVMYAAGNEITVEATVNTSAPAPAPDDTTPFEQYSAGSYVGASCPVLFELTNPSASNLAFEVTYTASGSRSGDLGATFGAGVSSNLNGLWDDCTTPISTNFYISPTFGTELSFSASGIDTVSIENLTLHHLKLWVTSGSRSDGTTYTDQNGEAYEMRNGQATATISIIVKLIELPE